MAAREVAHRRLVRKRDDRPLGSRFEHRFDLLRRCPRDHAQVRVLLLDAPHVRDVGAARRMPDVAEPARPPDRLRRAAADPDLGWRRRQRLRGRVAKRPVTAVERVLTTPERAHQLDRLVSAAAATLELHAHELELVAVPAHADAERYASTRELLQGGHLLRQLDRVVQGQDQDRRAQLDPLRPACDPGERDERVVDAPVGIDSVGPDDDVLCRPDRIEAELVGGFRKAANQVG